MNSWRTGADPAQAGGAAAGPGCLPPCWPARGPATRKGGPAPPRRGGRRPSGPGRPAEQCAGRPALCHPAGISGVAVRLVLHAAALTAGRLLGLARQAREVPVRSRSDLLAELLMSESAINEDLLERARQLAIPIGGWHVVVRIEADDLHDTEPDEVQHFELLDAAGQAALQAAAATGGGPGTCPGSPAPSCWSGSPRPTPAPGRAPGQPGRRSGRSRPSRAGCRRCGSAPGWARRTRPHRAAGIGREARVPCWRRGPRPSRPASPRTTRSASGGCSCSGTRPILRAPRCGISSPTGEAGPGPRRQRDPGTGGLSG